MISSTLRLEEELSRRLMEFAKKKSIKYAVAARLLIRERLDEIETSPRGGN